ncbi:NAD(P)/FAD-dependent oxidoreductase [Acidimangrovimonas sediminis]|uniref:NAD(P)/FAD-dependent oxidoreductase n=1 Tax=Acidimangrovimonas sediminis TaxID=2056283 RepID=UPI000C7FA6D5|nr:FAD-dependent oxidoreductase [Acidimangrovimonas sediminis]
MDADYVIIGGGVVGLSVAYGLLNRGKRVTVVDGGDGAIRASRGNFGLVWVQSKGIGAPHYARWSQASAGAWGDYADELRRETGNDLQLQQNGGLDFHLSEESLAAKVARYDALKEQLGGDYPFEVLGANALQREEPEVGPRVAGAILHHQDGHVNPLRLLRTLAQAVRQRGATVLTGESVTDVGAGLRVTLASGRVLTCDRVVLAAGLGAMDLGPKLGFRAPIRPQRGQVLITEKLPRLLNRPSGIVRQVDEGGIQIGDSKEEVGLDDRVTVMTTAALAQRAVAVVPALAQVQLVRTWAALRIMSPDGLPIYQKSQTLPGVAMVTCHSGVTLSAAHARFLPDWLEAAPAAPDLEKFSEDRFTV